MDRRTHRGWVEAGRPTPVDTARAIARETLAKHVPTPLPAGASEALAAIIKEADARVEAAGAGR
jgi:trimethylamine:corrinoid methyltransferase-like protein